MSEKEAEKPDSRLKRRGVLGLVAAGLVAASGIGYEFSSNSGLASPSSADDPSPEAPGTTSSSEDDIGPVENIKNYGGIEGDSSVEAAVTNIKSIGQASRAAKDNTVFLPAGEWYIGPPTDTWRGFALRPGDEETALGAPGLSFVGEGPDKTFLRWGHIQKGHANSIVYADDVDHGEIVWRNLTYDGNYQQFDFSDTGTVQGAIYPSLQFNATIEDCRFMNFQQTGIRLRGGALTVDRSTFHNIGIGRLNQTGGRFGHPIEQGGADVRVTNSQFSLIPGSCVDCTSGAKGTLVMKNVYAEGIGVNLVKVNDAESVELDGINYTAQTQELLDVQDADNETVYDGRWFLRRQSGSDNSPVPVTINDVLATDTTRGAIRVANGYNVALDGGRQGPIAFRRLAQSSEYDEGIEDPESMIFFDMGDLSGHDIDGTVFSLEESLGTIDRLKYANTDGIGTTAAVTISEEMPDAATFVPAVPSQDEVGTGRSLRGVQ